jgi:aspartate racemase
MRESRPAFCGFDIVAQGAGAQAAAVTSMGGHFCIGEILPISPLPVLNGIPDVDAAVKRGKFKTIGIIGTRMVMETRLYRAISSAAVVVPLGAELDEVHDNYVAMATAGRVNDAQRRVFFAAGERLCREQSAEVVLLGGTDLFLAFQDRDADFPVLDCADVHVEVIYQASLRTT